MTETKREWLKPELIVLVRSRPEEAVLGSCKIMSGSGPGPLTDCMREKNNGQVTSCNRINGS